MGTSVSPWLWVAAQLRAAGRGLHSFPFQLDLSSSVHRLNQFNS